MCDILHLRHTKVWLRPNWLFNLTKYGKDQTRLLEIIHGLTKKVIARKKQELKSGKRNIIDDSAKNGNSTQTVNSTKVIFKIFKKPRRWTMLSLSRIIIVLRAPLWKDFPSDKQPV